MTFENSGFTPYMFKTPQHIRDGDLFPFWPQNSSRIEIYGTKRMMYVGRHGGGWQVLAEGPQELGQSFGKVVAQQYGRFPDDPHLANFIQCIRERRPPNADIGVCHHSACLEHLANMAYRLGNQKLRFDSATETFIDNEEANRWLKPRYSMPKSRSISRALLESPICLPFAVEGGLWTFNAGSSLRNSPSWRSSHAHPPSRSDAASTKSCPACRSRWSKECLPNCWPPSGEHRIPVWRRLSQKRAFASSPVAAGHGKAEK
jgi:hypothetical protein